MNTIETYLADLRDEVDEWVQAKHSVQSLLQEAASLGAAREAGCLGAAVKYAIEQEARARERLAAAEMVAKHMEQK